MEKYSLTSLIFLFICFHVSAQNDISDKCFLEKETFSDNLMDKYLEHNVNDSIISSFVSDSSSFCLLKVHNKEFELLTIQQNQFLLKNKLKEKKFFDSTLIRQLNQFTSMNSVYALNCDKDFIIFDGALDFTVYWIKEKGEIKFIYYSKRCGFSCLTEINSSLALELLKLDKKINSIW